MELSEFDYELPPELIAQQPKAERTSSKLMILLRESREIIHCDSFVEIIDYLQPGDLLVVNSTKVVPAKLMGKRTTGAKVEILVIHSEGNVAEVFIKTRKRPQIGETYHLGEYSITVKKCLANSWLVDFGDREAQQVMADIGIPPLPPYIKRKDSALGEEDKQRYQTVYAHTPGAIAAPTAGLHFSDDLLTQIQQKGVALERIVLHVGIGTFLPVKTSTIEHHKMHKEEFEISPTAAANINKALQEKRRVICVGTTSCRALESSYQEGEVRSQKSETEIFIYPGYSFQVMRGLVTNFHLPKSTLLLLVSAFADKDFIMQAYQEAITKKYRFFSYGDAMLIL